MHSNRKETQREKPCSPQITFHTRGARYTLKAATGSSECQTETRFSRFCTSVWDRVRVFITTTALKKIGSTYEVFLLLLAWVCSHELLKTKKNSFAITPGKKKEKEIRCTVRRQKQHLLISQTACDFILFDIKYKIQRLNFSNLTE